MKVFLTGATGFLGRAIASELISRGQVDLTVSLRCNSVHPRVRISVIENIDGMTNWSGVLSKQEVVIHAAAQPYIQGDGAIDAKLMYQRVNVEGTLNLARQAAASGVKRFIFISSIKVNGEQTLLGRPFNVHDAPDPADLYALSKWEAEVALNELADKSGMELVIIRPPLIYGPGVKGNFARIISLIKSGAPLPLGAIYNKRSLVGVDNLVDLIITCIDHASAANQVFLVSDGRDLSTTELLRCLSHVMNKRSRLIPIPASLLFYGISIFFGGAVAQRLLGSLQVDNSKAKNLLGWNPHVSVEEGLRRIFVVSEDWRGFD